MFRCSLLQIHFHPSWRIQLHIIVGLSCFLPTNHWSMQETDYANGKNNLQDQNTLQIFNVPISIQKSNYSFRSKWPEGVLAKRERERESGQKVHTTHVKHKKLRASPLNNIILYYKINNRYGEYVSLRTIQHHSCNN